MVPQASAVQRDETHCLLGEGLESPPLGGLALVFLLMEISIVGWLPCFFILSASSSLTSLYDFLLALFEGLSKVSSSEEQELSARFLFSISTYEGLEGMPWEAPSGSVSSPYLLKEGVALCSMLSGAVFGGSVRVLYLLLGIGASSKMGI